MDTTLLIDIGNSAIKAASANPVGIIQKWTFPHTSSDKELGDQFKNIACASRAAPATVLISSVVPNLTKKIIPAIANLYNAKIKLAGKDISIPLENRYKNPCALGIDRLIAAYAATKLFAGTDNFIVVDFGTAITFDCICQNAYVGGLIFPGPVIAAKALAAHTAQLPEVDITAAPDFLLPGSDTVNCIRNGLFFGYAALINGLCKDLRQTLPQYAKVIATGGYAKKLENFCPVLDTIIPDLVLQGLWWLHYDACHT